ncbi:hypothetical protein SK128_012119 [Halocaridina rubra]|uniref:Uncharacterized protein n=1 Tax=Halocaridina rubra TaxID=373956 RepID=A0AAN9A856_HALRR
MLSYSNLIKICLATMIIFSFGRFSADCDDIEPELEAIPESPKTDSPSCQELCDLEPYENLVFGEQAVVRVEHDHSSQAFVTRTPCAVSSITTATASIVVPQTIRAQAVTSVMASQIQAFDESFTVKIHNAELAGVELNPEENERIVMASLSGNEGHNNSYKHRWFLGDDSEEVSSPEIQKLEEQEIIIETGANSHQYAKVQEHFEGGIRYTSRSNRSLYRTAALISIEFTAHVLEDNIATKDLNSSMLTVGESDLMFSVSSKSLPTSRTLTFFLPTLFSFSVTTH